MLIAFLNLSLPVKLILIQEHTVDLLNRRSRHQCLILAKERLDFLLFLELCFLKEFLDLNISCLQLVSLIEIISHITCVYKQR